MTHKVKCTICLGSNHCSETHLATAAVELSLLFGDIRFGSPVTTEAEGELCHSSAFYVNQAAVFTTTLGICEIKAHLKRIERMCGRTPEAKSLGVIPLDIDLLVYGETIVRPADMQKRYVRLALSHLPPE